MPNYLSVDARSLINEMLAVDPVKRITTPEITQHHFYTTALRTFNDASRPFHHNPSIISKYDAFVGVTSDESVPRTGTDGPGLRKDVVDELASRMEGVDKEDIWECLRRTTMFKGTPSRWHVRYCATSTGPDETVSITILRRYLS